MYVLIYTGVFTHTQTLTQGGMQVYANHVCIYACGRNFRNCVSAKHTGIRECMHSHAYASGSSMCAETGIYLRLSHTHA